MADITFYESKFGPDKKIETYTFNVGGSVKTIQLTGLDTESEYYFKIRNINGLWLYK